MPLPDSCSLSLQGHSRPGAGLDSKPKNAMIVRMSEEVLDALQAFTTQPHMDFQFGDLPGIYIGDTFFPVRSADDISPHELYIRTSSALKPMAPLKLYANVSGKFTVERELGEKVQAKVKDRTTRAEVERTQRHTILLDSDPTSGAKNTKKRKAVTLDQRPLPSRPVPSTSTLDLSKDAVIPTRIRLIHCLALAARQPDEIVKLVGGADCDLPTRKEILQLIKDVAEQEVASKKGAAVKAQRPWKLRTESWLDVRPYEWTGLIESERTNMARQARLAYKQLKIPESDPRWDHVRFRGPNGNAKPDPASSKDVKEKKSSAKAKAGLNARDVAATAKNESGSGSKVVSKAKDADRSESPSPTKLLAGGRKPPGSGYRAPSISAPSGRVSPATASPMPTPTSTPQKKLGPVDARAMKKESPAPSGPARPAPPIPPPGSLKKSVGTGRIPKKDPAAAESNRRAVDSLREGSSAGAKRKKSDVQDGADDSTMYTDSGSVAKKRKTDGAGIAGLPPKPALDLSLQRRPVKREPSPLARPISKKAASPLPPPPASQRTSQSNQIKVSSSASSSSSTLAQRPVPRERERDRETERVREREEKPVKVNGMQAPTRTRRKSPIYTSSEDEDDAEPRDAHKSVRHERDVSKTKTKTSHHARPRARPSLPLSTDHAGLRARYSSCYVEYIGSFHELIAQKSKIERLLSRGGAGGTDSEGDVDMMDTEELAKLSAEHNVLKEELETIQKVFQRS